MRWLLLHIIISLLTCDPGEVVYERFGHTALRVQDTETGSDVVFNYGLFDFEQPNFYGRFIQGKTYYQIGAQYTEDFVVSYAREHRRIYSQVLNLSEEQATWVRDSLVRNMAPENREYLYNFVFDNCATRPLHLIYPGIEGKGQTTYRELIARYVGPYHYTMFGINLLLGSRADMPADSLWLPECVMNRLAADSIVGEQYIAPFPKPEVHWYEDIRLWLSLFALALLVLTLYDRRRHQLTWGVDLVLVVLYILAFLLVGYLTWFSLHPLVGFGPRLLIIPAIHLCLRLFYFVPSRF